MRKTTNSIFAFLLAFSLMFIFVSCSDEEDDDIDIAGNTYVLSSLKNTETDTNRTSTSTMSMPSGTKYHQVSDSVEKENGATTFTMKMDITITKGASYTVTVNSYLINGKSATAEQKTELKTRLESQWEDGNNWKVMESVFSNNFITINKDGTWSGTIDGESQTGTYTIDTKKSKITVYTDGESDSYDVGYSNGGKTLTLTESETEEGTTSVNTLTFTRK